MNKGILCEPCNKGFDSLDGALAQQLNIFNGLIGVRPDHEDWPKPARLTSTFGALTMDHHGQPKLAAPQMVVKELLPDGKMQMSMRFADQKQVQDWVERQRAQGIGIKQIGRRPGRLFVPTPIEGQCSFGGELGFRAVARVALNFLATRWPDVARHEGLQSFKDYVRGVRSIGPSEPRAVWYAPADAFPFPESKFPFGHQILVVLDAVTNEAYARVRFFSTLDLFVWFGRLGDLPSEVVLFDIDPLVEQPPNDRRVTSLTREAVPATIVQATKTREIDERLTQQVQSLFARIEDRQWKLSTSGLLDALNEIRGLPNLERRDRVRELLEPHLGRVLSLIRYVVEIVGREAEDETVPALAQRLDAVVAEDPASEDGLRSGARAWLQAGRDVLSDELARELEAGPMTDHDLRLWLAGGRGAAAVGMVVLERLSTLRPDQTGCSKSRTSRERVVPPGEMI